MNTLVIRGKKIIYKDASLELNDLYTNEFYEKCDGLVGEYIGNLYITNEVYLNRVQPFKAFEIFLSDKHIDLIKLYKPDKVLIPLVLDFSKGNNIKIVGNPLFYTINKCVISHINVIISMFYLLWKMIQVPKNAEIVSDKDKISLIRTPAAKKKLSFLDDVDIRFEDFRDRNSIYNCFSRITKIKWIIASWLKSYGEINKFNDFVKKKVGLYSSYDSFEYYSKRVVHTMLYAVILEEFISKNDGKILYTGNNLDRFALIEEEIASKYNVKIVCIPHGLEYGFKLPHCFVGDVFYTTSLNASTHLNKLYETNKFVYEQNMASKMFFVCNRNNHYDKKIVFFTEPREVEVNFKIINDLLSHLEERNLQLYLKLHPKDKKQDYNKYSLRVKFIEDFNSSVTNNICISRKSTTLLESIYNGSKAAAILINSKDEVIFNTFPSLRNELIEVFYSTNKLFDWILYHINNDSK